mgnify:CR=1 FL=1
MVIERLNPEYTPAEDALREYIFVMLRKGYNMNEIIRSLMSIKIEMANALLWQDVVSDALYKP